MAITKINTPELFDLGSTNTSLQLPSGNTASRPSNPSTGEWRFNTDDNKVEYWDGSAWTTIEDEAIPLTASENFNVNTYLGSGATQTIDAQFNEAAVFNGSSSKVDIDSLINTLDSQNIITTSFWFKSSSTSLSGLFSYRGSASTDVNFLVSLSQVATGDITLVSSTSSAFVVLGNYNGSYNDGNWHHVVASINYTTGAYSVYIDNVSRITGTNASISRGTADVVLLGSNYNSQYLNGAIDQVRIFNTALTQQQVNDLYTNETTETAGTLNFPTGAGCIAAYQLDGDASDVGGTYGGVPTDLEFVGLKFEPGLVWVKNRTGTVYDHKWADSVRGATKIIESSTTDVEITATGSINAFNTNGFTIGTDNSVNGSGTEFVAWCFKAADTTTSYPASGTQLAADVRANTNSGFSIIKYTGSGTSGDSIPHGLNARPDLIFVKGLDNARTWMAKEFTTMPNDSNYLALNTTDEVKSSGSATFILSTTDSSVVVLGNSERVNFAEDYVAYCFHSVTGYQKIDSYQGTGAAGNYVETGFEPAWLMIKETSSTGNWRIVDNKRNTTNPRDLGLWANLNNIESASTANLVDFYSNGFSLEGSGGDTNTNGQTYIYLAIAADAEPTPVLANSFDVVTYSGNSGTQDIQTNSKPDLVWIKSISTATSHVLNDSVRGIGKNLYSNLTSAQGSTSGGVTSYNENVIRIANDSSQNLTNTSGRTYVAWCWKAAGIGAINTEGSITSIANANQAAGFSIVKYKANGSVGATFGHGLSSAPELVIWKELGVDDWMTIADINGTYQRAKLNTTDIFSTSMSGVTNNVDPTDTVITLGNSGSVNSNGLYYIVYCFHSVPGYSQVGTYNLGTSGTTKTVVTGFQPRFVMLKSVDYAANWTIFDSLRGDGRLFPNTSGTESTSTSAYNITLNTDGFTMSGTGIFSSGTAFPNDDVLYLAIA